MEIAGKEGAKYIRVADISRIWQISESTLWRWTREGKFPAPLRMGKRCTRWRKEEIEAFFAKIEKLGA